MMWQIVAAVAAAWCVAIGAAAQELPAVCARGGSVAKLSLLTQLIRNRRWLLGALVTCIGIGLHLAALATAPLTVIQPLGISGLLVAVWIAARWRGRSLSPREWSGAVMVTIGLTGLILSLPREAGMPTQLADSALAYLAVCAIVIAAAALLVGRHLKPRGRALLFALIAGICFAITASLVRRAAPEAVTDLTTLWHWRSGVMLIVVCLGGLLLQNSYRAGHFGLTYAVLLIVDPLVAFGIGVLVLNEPSPKTGPAVVIAVISAAATVLGVLGLAYSHSEVAYGHNRLRNYATETRCHHTGTAIRGEN